MPPSSEPRVRSSIGLGQILRRTVIGQLLIVFVIIVATTTGYFVYRSTSTRDRVTSRTLYQLAQADADLLEAQTSHRGWVLIEDPRLLSDFEESVRRVDTALWALTQRLESDQRAGVAEADAIVEEWRAEFALPTVALVKDGQADEAAVLMHTGVGQARIDSARALIAKVTAGVERDLNEGVDRSDAAVELVVIALLVGAFALAIGAVSLSRGMQRRVTDPMAHLADAAERLGDGDLTTRAEAVGVHEVQVVAGAFNAMAEQLQHTVTGLRELDELKTQFVSSVSHELRTPLTSIRGYLEVLTEHEAGPLNPEQQECAEIAYRNAGRLEILIEDLLALAKLETGHVSLNPEPVDMAAMSRRVEGDFLPRSEATGVSLAIDAPVSLWVWGDPDRLQQVLTNLVSNAIKFTPSGGWVQVEATGPDEGRVQVKVTDSGVGIPEAELPRLFDRFFRASTSEGIEGTGLGLAISQELMRLHHGSLDAESTPGVGSTFTLTLPALEERPEPEPEHEVST